MTLTELDLADLMLAGIAQDAPYAIYGVSRTQFSIARHYGGCTFQRKAYTYFAESDSLIRDDVVAWLKKRDRKVLAAERAKGKTAQADAQGGLL